MRITRMGAIAAAGTLPPPFDPLTIGWAHSYWTDGPLFTALGLADGAAVGTWPDESGANDMTQATAGNKPVFRASESTLGTRPAIDFVGGTGKGLSTGVVSTMAMPNEIVMVGRQASAPAAGGGIFWARRSSDDSQSHFVWANDATTWKLYNGINLVGGATLDTSKHLFRAVFDDPNDELNIDGSTYVSGDSSGSSFYNAYKLFLGSSGSGTASVEPMLAFVGVSDVLLSSSQRSDLLAWAQAYYGTP